MRTEVCRSARLIPVRSKTRRAVRATVAPVLAQRVPATTPPISVSTRRLMMIAVAMCFPTLAVSSVTGMDWQEAKRKQAERRKRLRRATDEAAESGEAVADREMDSLYSLPDDHSPNTHGRKSRTVPVSSA
ncbi:hypothetical protein BSKO_08230 [Bryopsis sp. KO-2023]|nr:hypothetical protein BSKO_08230 [Bryopsis sp. KO-2023]